MEIHKPKPIHNWRDFLKEYAIIVLGVATALAAEQAVEWWHWRGQVAEARGIIASEMANNLNNAGFQLSARSCIESRLNEIGRILDHASREGNLPPMGLLGTAPRLIFSTGAWDSLVASQTASHFPRGELAQLAVSYNIMQKLETYSPIEQQTWYELGAMTGPGRRLDPASEAELRKALSVARGFFQITTQLNYRLINSVSQRNLPYNQADLQIIAEAKRYQVENVPGNATSSSTACRPIGAAPIQYGQAGGLVPSPEAVAKSLTLLPGGK
ncbi:MAG: hypothetical protein JO256_07380 [Alphaproteobacteria bacterium]|nr:hypothetical protein [Alphaproteobacteria bacterium]